MNRGPAILPGMQRIFIGVQVDRQAQRHINELLRPLKELGRDIRWVPENNRHLTLAFLGNVPVSEVDILVGLFDETYWQEQHFRFKLTRLTRFPESTSTIIALTGKPGRPMDNLFQITLRLLQSNDQRIDRKEFRPHVTVARLKRAKQLKTAFDQQANIYLDIAKITLYQSILTECGPVYSVLKETTLQV